MLGSSKPVLDNNDVWVWKLSHRGIFSLKSFYFEFLHTTGLLVPYKTIWNPDITSKVSFFISNSFLDKILTLNHLQSRVWKLANRRILCMAGEESVSHLFIHCLVAKVVWDFFLSHLNFSWIFPNVFNALISSWWIGGHESFHLSL